MDCCQVLGVISPKMRISRVRMPVVIPTYAFPRIFMVSVVMREETDIFTMLFPINTVLSIFGESEIIFSRITARLLPCSARDCIRILFTVVIAVSAEEKMKKVRSVSESPPPERQYLNPRFIHSFDYLY